jgi:putative ATP-binding cassette transporter
VKLILLLLKDSRRTVIFATLCGAVSGACTAFILRLIQQAIAPAAGAASGRLELEFVGVCLLFLAATLGSHIPLVYLSEGALLRMRVQLVRSILKGRLRFLEQLGGHRLYAALAGDVDRITEGLAVMPAILISTVVIFGCLIFLGVISWKALLSLLVALAGAITVFVAANRRAMVRLSKARETGNVLFKHFRAVAEGAKELKLHAPRRRAFLDTMLLPTAHTYRKLRIAGLAELEAANAIANLGYFAVIGFLLFVLPVIGGGDRTVLASAVLVFVFMLAPLTTLGNHFHTFAQAEVALKSLESLGVNLGAPEHAEPAALGAGEGGSGPAPGGEPAAAPAPGAVGRVVFRDVGYTYTNRNADERFTLGPLDLELRPEVLFVTGGNGSGKSTLGKLLVGLYEPDSGSIELDGRPVVEENREWYRQHCSAIFGDFFLFERLLGIEHGELDGRAGELLAELRLTDKLTVERGELSTTDLSTGQRKRLALLVAYLEDRPIMLFDEWAADQDPQFKEIFYKGLLPDLRRRGKIVVVITHDDRYFGLADRVVKLADGRLTADEVQLPAREPAARPAAPALTPAAAP